MTPRTTELAAGTIVAGKYTVTGPLGRSPWAVTYRALAEPSRDLVLKVWALDASTREAIEKDLAKRHEALLAMPDHGLLPPIAFGIDEEKSIGWIASTLASTPSLAELVDLCPLTTAETAAFLRSLARALSAGPPHLALKPTNVFVGPAPKYPVHLADYEAPIVRRRAGPGTLPWDAPESGGDARTDVFGAALLAFFAMTRATFRMEGDTRDETLRMAASVRARAVGVTLPPSLDAVFARAFAVSPGGRFGRVSELAIAFAKAIDVELPASAPVLPAAAPLAAPPPPPPPPPVVEDVVPPLEAPSPLAADSDVAVVAPLAPAPAEMPRKPREASAIDLSAFTRPRRSPLLYVGIAAGAFVVLASVTAVALHRGPKPEGDRPSGIVAPPAKDVVAPREPARPVASVVASAPPDPPPPPALAANESELEIQCEPACDRIAVDGKVMESAGTTLNVKPGFHGIGVAKEGYVGDWRRVEAVGGTRTPVAFTLTPAAGGVAVAPRPSPPPPKKCGKFLKRCD